RIESANPKHSIEVVERDFGNFLFTSEGAPLELRVKGRRLPEWKLIRGSADPPPPSPVSSQEPEESLTLIPYGSAKLSITAFPQLAKEVSFAGLDLCAATRAPSHVEETCAGVPVPSKTGLTKATLISRHLG